MFSEERGLLLERIGGWIPDDPIPHRNRNAFRGNRFCRPNTDTCQEIASASDLSTDSSGPLERKMRNRGEMKKSIR